MISYNKESRANCVLIKEALERLGKTCWMDIDDMRDNTIDSMENAVKQSSCVLICYTEKYFESDNCKAEAEYTWKINKPFVPIKMQQGYEPKGWLSFILGNKLLIDINKYRFDEFIQKLNQQIDDHLNNN